VSQIHAQVFKCVCLSSFNYIINISRSLYHFFLDFWRL